MNKKSIFVIGQSEIERRRLINEIIDNSNLEVFRFPKAMKSYVEYFKFCGKNNLYFDRKDVTSHIDWIAKNKSLIVLEEFQYIEENWKLEIINYYIEASENRKKGQEISRFIISQNDEDGLFNKLEEKITLQKNERRTKRQIILQHIESIHL